MATGLSLSDIVNVQVVIAPLAAGTRNFGALLILGSSNVIDTGERLRPYATLEAIADDFGTTAPEYYAADLFFSQSPQPNFCYVGRWAQSATSAVLHGATLTASQQAMTNFTPITNGSMKVAINGADAILSGLDFSGATNLNGIASIIQAALPSGSTCKWDSILDRFTITSPLTGTNSIIAYAVPTGAGTNVATILGFSLAAGASAPVNGVAAESLVSAVAKLADMSPDWYGLTVATTTKPSDADHVAVAGLVEGLSQSRIYGVTITSTTVLDPTSSGDLASQIQALGYKRTFTQNSSSSAYATASLFGRAFTVNFTANNTTITLKFKQEPGIVPELLTESQAAVLKSKNCNAFVRYNNSTSIIQGGVMANGYFFDEVHGLDWFQNTLQTNIYNVLYTSTTKVPQTDAGTHLLVAACVMTCEAAVNNGLVAPGVWNVAGFGSLSQGDTLPTGYYVYAPLVATQAQSDREARKSVPIQIALKLAGAVHDADVLCTVNR